MAKLIRKLCLLAACVSAVLGIFVAINVLGDPYNVFHTDHVRDTGVEPNKNFIKMKYILKNKDKFDTFIFGSSRVVFLYFDTSTYEDYYNMSYSEGLPKEHLDNLKVMLREGVKPKRIFLGVDNISYLVDPALHEDLLIRMPYPENGNLIPFYVKNVSNWEVTKKSFLLLSGLEKPEIGNMPLDAERFYKNGESVYNEKYQAADTVFDNPYWDAYYEDRMDEALEEIREFRELCEENDIELTVFINPLHYETYYKSVRHGLFEFMERLAEITPYYNFTGLNKYTTDNEYFFETSHYKPEVGYAMVDAMCYGRVPEDLASTWFGMLVTKDNAASFTDYFSEQLETVKKGK